MKLRGVSSAALQWAAMVKPAHIAIVGAGFSGSLTAIHLLRLDPDCQITLFDRSGDFGPGLAYSTPSPVHFLNVPAGNMSAFADEPSHFLRWAQARDPSVGTGSFVPRGVYGAYLRELLQVAGERSGGRLRCVQGSPVALQDDHAGLRLTLDRNEHLIADRLVLACGNSEPCAPNVADARILGHPGYIANPWAHKALDNIKPDEPVLILGTGLTMVDVVMSLQARDHAGRIMALSRHGLLPRPHRSPSRPPAHKDAPLQLRTTGDGAWDGSAKHLLQILRQAVRENAGKGTDWRDVITSIRSMTPGIWRRMNERERSRFLFRLRSYWDVVRHRAAPESAAAVADMIAARQLVVRAGRLLDLRSAGAQISAAFRPRGSANVQTQRVSRVINCMGPDSDMRRSQDPLLKSALAAGLISPDVLGLGLEVAEDGRALQNGGLPHERVFVVGPMRRGQAWEATAVPELRVQAAQTATDILKRAATARA